MSIMAVTSPPYDHAMVNRGAGIPSPSDIPALVGLDIETDTAAGGLDPATAGVVAVAVTTDDGDHVLTGHEASILRGLESLLAGMPPGLLVTWNGAAFDLPFLARRAAMAGVPLGLELVDDPARRWRRDPGRPAVRARWHRLDHLDGFLLYSADVRRAGISCALKPLARFVGLHPVELDRSALHLADPEDLEAYVASDARMAVELVRRRMPLAAAAADFPLPARLLRTRPAGPGAAAAA